MEFNEVIIKRRSIRKFAPDPVPEALLTRIFEAARLSPTWGNRQGVRYIVVTDPPIVQKIKAATLQGWTKSAPMFIVVCIDPKDSGKNPAGLDYFTVDAAICLTQLILAATNEGLGTVWMGWFDEGKIRDALKIPESIRIVGLTPLGYPDPKHALKAQERKSLSDLVFRDIFNEPYYNSSNK